MARAGLCPQGGVIAAGFLRILPILRWVVPPAPGPEVFSCSTLEGSYHHSGAPAKLLRPGPPFCSQGGVGPIAPSPRQVLAPD